MSHFYYKASRANSNLLLKDYLTQKTEDTPPFSEWLLSRSWIPESIVIVKDNIIGLKVPKTSNPPVIHKFRRVSFKVWRDFIDPVVFSKSKREWLESLTEDEKSIHDLSHRWGVTPMGVRHWLHTPSDTYLPFYKALWAGVSVNTEPRYEQCADITAVLHEYGIGLREFSRDTGRHVVTLRGYALHERKCSMFWDLLEGYRVSLGVGQQ